VITVHSQPNRIHPPDGRPHDKSLNIDVHRLDHETMVVTLRGEADIATLPALREVGGEAAQDGLRRLIVDLDGLTFLDAATLDWLAETRKRLCANGATLQVECHTDLGRRLLTATGLDFLLD
jgi:anti-sigma B factor antagonist